MNKAVTGVIPGMQAPPPPSTYYPPPPPPQVHREVETDDMNLKGIVESLVCFMIHTPSAKCIFIVWHNIENSHGAHLLWCTTMGMRMSR